MEEKVSNFFKNLFMIFITLTMTNCAVEELGSKSNGQESISFTDAKNWFDGYKSTALFKPEFSNLVYDWENSKIELLDNDLQALVVPVIENNGDNKYKGQKLLYIYSIKEKNSYETTLYELLPTNESLIGEKSLQTLSNFNGYIAVYSLETGFIESTKFENSVPKATIRGNEIPRTLSTNAFGKMVIDPPAASYCLGDVLICNGYKEEGGGYIGTGYVYYAGSNYYIAGEVASNYYSTTSHGSGGSGSGSGKATSVFINIEGQKVDPKAETKCFDKTKSATLTIYVQQPNENTRDKMGANSVGHTFIGIQQGGIERVLGFYPDSPNASLISSQASEIHDNSNTLYHVSISTGIDAGKLTNVINYIDNYPKTYDLNNYNCSDFAHWSR